MIHGEKEVAVKIRQSEKYRALIETREDGKEVTYYPRRFAIHWNCTKLEVRQSFEYRTETDIDPPRMFTYVTGIAYLTSDRSISVIGEPKNETVSVALSFRPDDSPDLLKGDDSEREPGLILSSPYGRAHMGFSRADWEIRSTDEWWLQCSLHSTVLRHLIDAIRTGTLEQVSLSVRLNNLFTDQPPYVPFSRDEYLFLRPNTGDNTISMREMTHGWLEGIDIRMRSLDLSPPQEPNPEPDETQEQPEVLVLGPTPLVQASQLMAAQIDALRKTMKWVGGLIVVVLLLLLFK